MRLQPSLLLLGLLVGPAGATTWRVPSESPTIAHALGVASPGDTVEIACGTYAEHDLVLKSGVVVRGETGNPACVVIDAGSAGRIALGMRITGAVLEGITFRGGFEASGPDFSRAVPGNPAEAHAPPDHDYGGGGALFLLHPDLTIRRCRFAANEAVVHGGALRVQGGTVRLEDVSFAGNVAGNQGGAFYAADDALLVLDGVTAEGNRAAQGGAGYASLSRIEAAASTFRGNRADGGGGALQLSRTAAVLSLCTFLDNEARRGGAIAMYTLPGTDLTAVGCTFARNAAATGAALAGPATLERTILAFHRDGPVVDCALGDVALSCCDVFGNEGGDFVDCLADESGVDGNFAADPLFCNVAAGIVALTDGSPCRPAASPCGQLVGAAGVGCPDTDLTRVDTVPTGLRVSVDDVEYTAPIDLVWVVGSPHILSAPARQEDGEDTRAAFVSWTDGGAATHEILVPPGGGIYVATYDAEHRLVTAAQGGGTVEPDTGWHPQGAIVDILATPAPDAVFAQWIGEGAGSYSGSSAAAQVTMSGPVRQTAYFATGGEFTLTMTSEGQGAVSPGSGAYPVGAEVGIAAVPAAGWEFVEWRGAGGGSYTGTQADATVSMWDDLTQHAVFRARAHPVTMSVSGHGTVTPASQSFIEGTVVPIRAIPDPGYTFVEWLGTGPGSYSGLQPEATVVVWGPITQVAVFTGADTHPLTMTAGAGGHVSPPSGQYATGSWVTIQAVPEAGHAFVAWAGTGSGSYTGASATAQVRMLGPITQSATFRPLDYLTLTMTADPGGSVTPPTGAYAEGTAVTITAFPDSGQIFLGWVGSGVGSYSGTANPATVTLTTTPVTQHARFRARVEVTVTTVPSGQPMTVDGVGYLSPRTFSWTEGTVHSLSVPAAVPLGVGRRSGFWRWSDGVASLTRYVAALPDGYHAAEYRLEYLLTQTGSPDGTVLPGTGWFPASSSLFIDAVPGPERVFAGWTGTGPGSYSGPASHATIVMEGPITETASFLPLGFEFSVSASDTDPWRNADMATGGPRDLHLWLTCADHGISAMEATFEVQGDLQVLGFTPVGNVLNAGDAANLLLAIGGCPSGGDLPRRLGTWVVQDDGGTACLGSSGGGYAAVECDPVNPGLARDPLVVGFASDGSLPCRDGEHGCPGSLPSRLLTMVAGPGGTVTPASGYHEPGTSVPITASPLPEHRFLGWTGTGLGSYTGTANPAVVVLSTEDVTQVAAFAPDSTLRLLTMIAGPGGTVTPASGYHEPGTSVPITALPLPEHRFLGWTGTGLGSYTGTANPAVVVLSTEHVTQVAAFAPDSAFWNPVTVTTDPAGLPMTIDGVPYVSPQVFVWEPGTHHTLAAPEEVLVAAGDRQRFRAWSDGVGTATRVVTIDPVRTYYGAGYDRQFLLSISVVGEGTATPGDSWRAAGSTVAIEAVPAVNHTFLSWAGEGDGSYSGPAARADVVMNGPVTEIGTFEPLGFELSISASATDPWWNADAVAGGPRELHLWLTCADHGISALEASIQPTAGLEVLGFLPAGGVLNAGNANGLLLAVGGCPGGAALPVRLGHWVVLDQGGAACLGPGAASGYAAVDCDPLHPGVAENPVAIGFASDGSTPCTAGEQGCGSGGAAASRMAALRAGWNAAAPVVTEDALGVAPNPFRGAAEIRLALKEEAAVRLDVFDVAGRLVRRITDERLPAGILTRRWDSRDAAGRAVPAGIYFVRLDTSTGFHAVRKIVFLGAR